MSRILSRRGFQDMVFGIVILLMLSALVMHTEQSVSAAREGVSLCINVILPSLFPFFVVSTLAVELGLIERAGKLIERFMYPLFHVNGSCAGAFLLGIIGGYPVGARTAISLYRKGQCSRDEAERMLSFCNNSGPAFILGVVGAGIFASNWAGLWLYAAHIIASVMVGLLFRSYHFHGKTARQSAPVLTAGPDFPSAFIDSVKSSFSSTLNICGFVIIFTVLIRMLYLTGTIRWIASFVSVLPPRFGFSRELIESLIAGLIEMTSGVWSLRDVAASMSDKMCMAAFILGWAGISVHCQVLSFIGGTGLNTRTYFYGKLLHGFLSSVLIFLFSRLFSWNTPVSAYLASQVRSIAHLTFPQAFLTAAGASLCLFFFLLLAAKNRKKNYSISGKTNV